MKVFKVTQLEKQVLESMAEGMYAECGFSDVGIEDIAKDTGLDPKVIRGVGSSLIKKGFIEIADREDEGYKNRHDMHIWYLTGDMMGLVPNWVEELNGILEEVILESKE